MEKALSMKLKFDELDAKRAHAEWGCNCGPAALAAVLGKTLDEIRPFMGPFEQRSYTNISNMREAIAAAGGRIVRSYESWPPVGVGLVRIQWGGPWIANGKPARWAATATHWIAAYRTRESHLYVFDVNGGISNVPMVHGQSLTVGESKATERHQWLTSEVHSAIR